MIFQYDKKKSFIVLSIGVIGAGQIGGTVAYRILAQGLGKVVFFDVQQGLAQGKAKDLHQAAFIGKFPSTSIAVANECKDLAHCDIIVITAGQARRPGMDRKDLLVINKAIIESIGKELVGSNAIVIVVTNPVDSMSFCLQMAMQTEKNRVIGMAGALDSGRFKAFLSEVLPFSSIEACVIGPHTNNMIPLKSSIHSQGLPITKEDISSEKLEEIIDKTRVAGAEIVSLLGSGSAFYGPAEGVITIIKAIVYDEKLLMPCSVKLEGEYGVSNLFCGVPVVLGKNGIEHIPEFTFTMEEQKAFYECLNDLRAELESINPNQPTNFQH